MPLQNRVLPTGDIVAIPARGTLTGNRGIIHYDDKTLGTSRWSHHAWICCTLKWQGRRRDVMTGRNWTELFFRDEATAFAAGHRPCGYCRRADYTAYVTAWTNATGTRPSAKEMDRSLHRARVHRNRSQMRYDAILRDLPSGSFVLIDGKPFLIWEDALHPFAPDGYGAPQRFAGEQPVKVLTPQPTVAALAAGYVPQVTL